MSKYEIEMTDEAVRSFVHDLREGLGGVAANHIADIFEAQIPIPVPVKIGAVVRTTGSEHGSLWVLTYAVPASWTTIEDPSGHLYLPDQIGRITEVLSPGVDL